MAHFIAACGRAFLYQHQDALGDKAFENEGTRLCEFLGGYWQEFYIKKYNFGKSTTEVCVMCIEWGPIGKNRPALNTPCRL